MEGSVWPAQPQLCSTVVLQLYLVFPSTNDPGKSSESSFACENCICMWRLQAASRKVKLPGC